MRITIDYEASWRNSFLDGDNNLPIPKQGRKYIGSGQELSKAGNYLKREITIDTVMGLLNRLIGCQQRLYQAHNCQFESSYEFGDLEFVVQPDFPEDLVAVVAHGVVESLSTLPEAKPASEVISNEKLHAGARKVLTAN